MTMHIGLMSAEPTARRETLALAGSDVRLVDRLMDPTSLERWALEALSDVAASASKSAVLRAGFRVRTDHIAEAAMDEGYRQLAQRTTADEAADERTIIASRRARAIADGTLDA